MADAAGDAAPGDLPFPTFVVIGAMRSGSTSLYKYLQDHPDVFMPRKEIHFFDRRWDHGVTWYRHRFEGYAGELAIGEATPTYLTDPVALDRMAATIPDARLVAVLRNPVDRAYSHYWMEHARDRDPRTFEQAIDDEQLTATSPSDYLARGRYAEQLEEVAGRFPREHVHVLLLDDLRDRPEPTYAAVCTFLGVDAGFVPPRIGEKVNRFVSFRSMRVRGVRRKLPTVLRIGRIVGRLNATDDPYVPMAAETRAALDAHFAEANDALAAWLGRDLPPTWSRRPP
ncbi:MAG: sulfotransferase [Ilumatobacteraceae bacterium]